MAQIDQIGGLDQQGVPPRLVAVGATRVRGIYFSRRRATADFIACLAANRWLISMSSSLGYEESDVLQQMGGLRVE